MWPFASNTVLHAHFYRFPYMTPTRTRPESLVIRRLILVVVDLVDAFARYRLQRRSVLAF